MLAAIYNAAMICKAKVHGLFQRVFHEQAGGAEIIAILIVIAVVLVLAIAFRDNISALVKSLWNSMTDIGDGSEPTIPEWQ